MIIEEFNELNKLISYLKKIDKELIFNALKFSDAAHKNQLRKSGEFWGNDPKQSGELWGNNLDG